MNEQITNAIDNFINSPVGSIITGVLGVIIVFLIIFSKTSLGKKLFSKAQRDILAINEIARLSNEKVNQVKLLAEEKINALTSEYERKSAIIVNYYNELEKGVYDILDKIPNQKVKEQLFIFKDKFDKKKEEIAQYFPTYDEFLELTNKAREVQEQVEERVKEIENAYNDRLAELVEKYENRFKELEDKLNEREEETNTDTEI